MKDFSKTDAYKLMRDLHSGNYHYTEEIKLQEFLQRPEIKKTLSTALHAMERLDFITRAQWTAQNSWNIWSKEEDQRLVNAFDRCLSINSLAAIHQRSEEAIRNRLIMLGKGLG